MNSYYQFEEFVNKLAEQRIQNRKITMQKSKDILDFFLDELENKENKNFKINSKYISDNFTTLVFAGIDTSSHTAGMAIYCLAKKPTLFDKIIKRNISIF